MPKRSRILCTLLCMTLLLSGCGSFDREDYWIKENIPTQTAATEVSDIPAPTETEVTIPTQLQMNTKVIAEGELRFSACTTALCNDLGVYLQRQLDDDLWLQEKVSAICRRMELDPILKNEPMIEVYTSQREELYEVTAILLTHDWTEAGEGQFLRLGQILLQCFWPECEETVINQTVAQIRKDINNNVYPDNSAVPRPATIYVCGNAAAYGYTHGAHISINVIPVTENRLQEMETAGVQIVNIP